MGSRPFSALGAILIAAALSACSQCGEPDPTPVADGSGEPASQPATGHGETSHLVGTDVDVETIEVTDEGPPAPTVLFTASLKGYTEPCGCTIDLVLGGIDRVSGYIDRMRTLATDSLVLDAGNTLFEHEALDPLARDQEIRKTQVLVAAMQAMGTAATVPGPTDFANGVDFYRDTFAATDIAVLGANIALADGSALATPTQIFAVGERSIGVIGAVDPTLYEEIEAVVTTDPTEVVTQAADAVMAEGADTTILLWQGDLPSARRAFGALDTVDFIIIGNSPRNTDETEAIGGAFSLEAYDQGRHVGRLKLACGNGVSDPSTWTSARVGSDDEVARLERVITGLDEQLDGMDFPEGNELPPIVVRLQERRTAMRAELQAMQSNTAPVFPDDACAFLYRPIDMAPGLPPLQSITEEMVDYNNALRALNMASATPPEPAAEGMPHYVGTDTCATCHSAAVETWHGTAHALAWETLETRDKQFDRSCIGCHVTGYQEPGGSTLGHTEGLVDVQCEQCHGPGSMHAEAPTLTGLPTGVYVERTEQTCIGCHNEEHSPRFEYETYLPRILGPGHGG